MAEEFCPEITEAAVRRLSRTKSFDRGESYYQRGAVLDVVRRGDTLRANVEGSQYEPYQITVEFDETGIVQTACSCPYDHGGICKHRVAVLLTYIRDTDEIDHRPPLSDVIESTDQETLQDLLIDLVERQPELAEWIETRLSETEDASNGAEQSASNINVESIRSQVNYALPSPDRGGPRNVHAAFEQAAEDIQELIGQAWTALEANDGETALQVLEAVTKELSDMEWIQIMPRDETAMFELFDEIDDAFAEALLTADLSQAERETWTSRLSEWGDELARYMGQSPFLAASTAAAEGWGDEALQRAMRGELDATEFETDDTPRSSQGVMGARLRVFARQDRIEEYLNLAAAAGRHEDYATMLIREGRIDEAVEYSTDALSTPAEFLSVAQTLREHGHSSEALHVAEEGLTVEGFQKGHLAEWLRDRASSRGNSQLAVRAAINAFKAEPSLSAYQAVEELVETEWEDIRTELLDYLRDQPPSGRRSSQYVDVLLYEEQYDDAIRIAEEVDRPSVIAPVVDAVLEDRPEWAIRVCKQQAEPIIEDGKYDRYSQAARWLERAGKAAEAANELEKWREYIDGILDRHHRKRKLVPMLEDLLDEFA